MPFHDKDVAGLLLLLFSALSLLACQLVMYLIYRLGTAKQGGYHRIVYTLAFLQSCYDISYMLIIGYREEAILDIYRICITGSGIAVCLWTNFISAILLYTITYLKPFDLPLWHRETLKVVSALSILFATVILVMSIVLPNDDSVDHFYLWFRAASTFVNAMVFLVIIIIFNQGRCANTIDVFCQHDFALRDFTQDLLALLTTRLVYYPIVQIFARLTAIWWEYSYGFEISGFDNGSYSTEKWISLVLYVIFSPSAGVGYLWAFLYVHPMARRELSSFWQEIRSFGQKSTFLLPKDNSTNATEANEKERTDSVLSTTAVRNTLTLVHTNQPNAKSQTQFNDSVDKTPQLSTSHGMFSTDNPLRFSALMGGHHDVSTAGEFHDVHNAYTNRGRQNSTDWMHNPRAFDIAEPLIWQEFYRRKLERESMTVHA